MKNLRFLMHYRIYLWIAALIFAASSSITRRITLLGEQHLVNGRNPISLCNVLFVGNLCALILMACLFSRQWNRHTFSQLTRQDWIQLGTVGLLSGALAPALIFAALDNTSVTNVVLFSRLEPPISLVIGVLFFRSKVQRWTGLSAIVGFAGIVVIAVLSYTMAFQFDLGILFVTVAAIILAIASNISKNSLQNISISVFNLVRTFLGMLIFFVIAQTLYGSQHFIDAFSPFLWQWMLLYSAVIVVGGQLAWFKGLKDASAAEITLAHLLEPIAAIAMAFLILGETPTTAQFVGGSIVLISICISLWDLLQQNRKHDRPINWIDEMMGIANFRGF
ncbi:DMT family transporter [Alkalinema pantanalense CENA528]|uniref:DMT family transporter n=1 Tax=Alkalinema pantanalense TaxID=1620705 RepID=UPI003D6E6C2A